MRPWIGLLGTRSLRVFNSGSVLGWEIGAKVGRWLIYTALFFEWNVSIVHAVSSSKRARNLFGIPDLAFASSGAGKASVHFLPQYSGVLAR